MLGNRHNTKLYLLKLSSIYVKTRPYVLDTSIQEKHSPALNRPELGSI